MADGEKRWFTREAVAVSARRNLRVGWLLLGLVLGGGLGAAVGREVLPWWLGVAAAALLGALAGWWTFRLGRGGS